MKERSPRQPEALWKEKDMADSDAVDAMVVILRTNGCAWAAKGGCAMCGYGSASMKGITEEDLMAQIDSAMERYDGEQFVKIYTSGSFLDDNEVPEKVRERIFREFGNIKRLLFESRPEFITKKSLSEVPKNVTIALGMESADNDVLENSIRKGFTIEDTKRAGTLIKETGLKVRSYLLLKPPYMSEKDAIDDALRSIATADAFSDEISINPVNVQRKTMVERLWKRAAYRPPWIWSLIEVLRKASATTDARLMSSPSGGGSQRGVHNCGECDRDALDAIGKFSFTQDINDLDVKCECISSWSTYTRQEEMLGTSADLDRMLHDGLAIKVKE